MQQLRVDYHALRKLAWGKSGAIQDALGVGSEAVTRRLGGEMRMTLDDLNIICSVVGCEPAEMIIVEKETKTLEGVKKEKS